MSLNANTVPFPITKRGVTDYGPLADLVNALKDAITADVRTDVLTARENLLTEIAQTIADAMARVAPPNVSVAPPAVHVAAPQVSTPVTVELPDSDDTAEADAITAQTQVLERIDQKLSTLILLFGKPVVREVERDSRDQIVRITESR